MINGRLWFLQNREHDDRKGSIWNKFRTAKTNFQQSPTQYFSFVRFSEMPHNKLRPVGLTGIRKHSQSTHMFLRAPLIQASCSARTPCCTLCKYLSLPEPYALHLWRSKASRSKCLCAENPSTVLNKHAQRLHIRTKGREKNVSEEAQWPTARKRETLPYFFHGRLGGWPHGCHVCGPPPNAPSWKRPRVQGEERASGSWWVALERDVHAFAVRSAVWVKKLPRSALNLWIWRQKWRRSLVKVRISPRRWKCSSNPQVEKFKITRVQKLCPLWLFFIFNQVCAGQTFILRLEFMVFSDFKFKKNSQTLKSSRIYGLWKAHAV